MSAPRTDPAAIVELYRGSQATELLVAAVAHFDLFGELARRPMSFEELRGRLGLAQRAAVVLVTAMRAMGLVSRADNGPLSLTAMSREHLLSDGEFEIASYLGLSAESAGVLELVQRLRSNRPAGADDAGKGAAYIYRDGIESAMESESSARRLTLALAGRARNVAPVLAERAALGDATRVLDVAAGSGIYTYALLGRHPRLRAVILDRAEVLKVARETAERCGVAERVEFVPADMFKDPLPIGCDVVLLSNVLHDWDVPECRRLVRKCADALPAGGRMLVHDVFLNDEMDGPLPIALYSASLFALTEGRAYSAAEYRAWLRGAGLEPAAEVVPTLVHCGLLVGRKRHDQGGATRAAS